MTEQERAIGVVLEGVQTSLKLVAEGHGVLNEKFDKLDRKFDGMAKDLETVKLDVAVLKTDVSVLKVDMRRVKHHLDLNGAKPKPRRSRRR